MSRPRRFPSLEALLRGLSALRSEVEELRREIRGLRKEIGSARGPGTKASERHEGGPARVGLFVDVQNIYYGARDRNARLDFGALRDQVSKERILVSAVAYVVQNPEVDQRAFLSMLRQRDFEIRHKPLKTRSDGTAKGDWDLGMALEIVRLAPSLDVVVLASGDGDFVPLVNQVRSEGLKVEVYSFPDSTARELIDACDLHVPIDDSLLLRAARSS